MAKEQNEENADSSQDSGESSLGWKFWIPLLLLVFAILLIPLAWLGFVSLLGGRVVLTGDVSSLLATIGGVMGAIFTVGGLVIALVAILTQISLEDRVRRATKKVEKDFDGKTQNAVREVEKKYKDDLQAAIQGLATEAIKERFENELSQAIEKQVTGPLVRLEVREALSNHNWQGAQRIVRDALRRDPQIPWLRSLLALWMSRTAMYSIKRRYGIVDTHNWRGVVEIQTGGSEIPEQELPTPGGTVDWLAEAVNQGENPEGECSAVLALMYGVLDGWYKMREMIRSLRNNDPSTLHWLRQPGNLIVLLDGCKNASKPESEQKDLLDLINFPFPTLDTIKKTFRPSPSPVYWVAIKKPEYWATFDDSTPQPDSPVLVAIKGQKEKWVKEGIKLTAASYYPFESDFSPQLSPDELIRYLDDKFIFICQAPYWWRIVDIA